MFIQAETKFFKSLNQNLFKNHFYFELWWLRTIENFYFPLNLIKSCYAGTEGLVKSLTSWDPQARWVSPHDSSLIWVFITCVLVVLNFIYVLYMLRNMIWFVWFWFVLCHHILIEVLNNWIYLWTCFDVFRFALVYC